jgi:hypothetical protein
MDRSEASSQNSSNRTKVIFLAKHNMPFWSAQRDNSQQYEAIQLPHIQGFLPSDGSRCSFLISIPPSVQWSSGKSECIDIHSHKKDTRELAERLMGRRAMKFTPFKLLYGEEPVTLKEIKLHNARTKTEAMYSPSEANSKYLLEPERMKAVKNLQSHQNETRAWGDKKVKIKHIEARDLELLRSPHTEASAKLEPKWTGPFVVTEKTRLGSFCLANNEGRVLEHSWNAGNHFHQSGHTLFLTGETHKGVRFLMR